MAAIGFRVQFDGRTRVLEALSAVDQQARFAQKTAMRAAARKGRSIIAKGIAARHKLPQKLLRHRVRFFYKKRTRNDARTQALLWSGLKRDIRASEHPAAPRQLKAQSPPAFRAKMPGSGHVGYFRRVKPSRRVGDNARKRPKERGALPITEAGIDITPGTRDTMIAAARSAMTATYPKILKHDYKRRIDKIRAKNR